MTEVPFTRGSVLGRKYTLEETLGEGPTGSIFGAGERFRGRVAVKVVRLPRSMKLRQFVRDVGAVQSVRSENVIFVSDVGTEGDTPYVVMELLEGRTLASVLRERGKLPLAEAVDYVLQASNGLRELHAAHALHRHIKPSNLFLTRGANGSPLIKLLDIGISSTELAIEATAVGDDASGALLDALKYASPEKLRNPARLDARTDIWSLAVTLYVLLSGRHPFEGDRASDIRAAISRGAPTKLSTLVAGIPEELDRVLERALTASLELRTPSIVELADELQQIVRGSVSQKVAEASAVESSLAEAPPAEASLTETPLAEAPPPNGAPVSRNDVPAAREEAAMTPPPRGEPDPVVVLGPVESPDTTETTLTVPAGERAARDAFAVPEVPHAAAPIGTLARRSHLWVALGVVAVLLVAALASRLLGAGASADIPPRAVDPPAMPAVVASSVTATPTPLPPAPPDLDPPPALEAPDAAPAVPAASTPQSPRRPRHR